MKSTLAKKTPISPQTEMNSRKSTNHSKKRNITPTALIKINDNYSDDPKLIFTPPGNRDESMLTHHLLEFLKVHKKNLSRKKFAYTMLLKYFNPEKMMQSDKMIIEVAQDTYVLSMVQELYKLGVQTGMSEQRVSNIVLAFILSNKKMFMS